MRRPTVPASEVSPAPGWKEGECWCGCGLRTRPPARSFNPPPKFFDRTHRSSGAPDGRLVTEHSTKFCQTCQTRYPKSFFPTKMFRRGHQYVERAGFYCQTCHDKQWEGLNHRPGLKERTRLRMATAYADPLMREQKKADNQRYRDNNRARREADPALMEQHRARKHEEWLAYKAKIAADPELRAAIEERRRARVAAARAERAKLAEAKLLDQTDPMVIPKTDPMVRWLYAEVDRYLQDRGLTGQEVLGELLGRNWMRWKPDGSTNGSKYMPLHVVDQILVRLGLQHRFDDFEFQRRSELKAKSWAEPAIPGGPRRRSTARSG